jgi:hypothetical protein
MPLPGLLKIGMEKCTFKLARSMASKDPPVVVENGGIPVMSCCAKQIEEPSNKQTNNVRQPMK